MRRTTAQTLWALRLGVAFAWALPFYWLAVFPAARRELRGWQREAERIPDPSLRRHALGKLRTEAMTAEGAAAFAIVATPRSCRDVVRACVAFEVLYDFLDALAEMPVANVLEHNRRLYAALAAALAPDSPLSARHMPHPCGGAEDYVGSLVETCRDALCRLPGRASVAPAMRRLALRAGEGQSLHHAATGSGGREALADWAAAQQPPDGPLAWWELAAAAGSPLGIFALVAAAGHRDTGAAAARAVERAYFPWIAALSWLLESLVDQEEDAGSDAHSYVSHYDTPHGAARRLTAIAVHAGADARALPQGARHTLLLAGMAGMYLSHAGAASGAAQEAAEAVRDAIGGPLVPLLWMLRVRRRLA